MKRLINTVFLTAEWRNLAMLNYEVRPGLLASYLPAGTELDLFDGRACVSVVAFQFCNTRVRGIAIPFHRFFEEVNLRFYVRRTVGNEVRRGVVFIRELVPRRAIAWVARWVYNENYSRCAMQHRIDVAEGAGEAPGQIAGAYYGWQFGGSGYQLNLQTQGQACALACGSEQEFIAEHYWGFARQRNGSTMEYRVEHPPWRVWETSAASLAGDMVKLYGPDFAPYLAGPPASAFLADGSPVAVYRGKRITA